MVNATFNMPDQDVVIEYWFKYARNYTKDYKHYYWDAYINETEEKLPVDYSASNN